MTVLRLYPAPQRQLSLQGLYLGLGLHRRAAPGGILIYANYIASIDGRISLPDTSGEQGVPASLANRRDWRLYQELAAQADIMLTSARYFRQLAQERAQDLLPVGKDDAYADLAGWRLDQGLNPQPDVAILSVSLDIPEAALEAVRDRRVLVLTGGNAPAEKVERLERLGVLVLVCGEGGVEGKSVRRMLVAEGYRAAYLIAGPGVFHSMLNGGLDLLFLTQRHRLLGGEDFRTILQEGLDRPLDLRLCSLYLDETDAPGQSFACYALSAESA